MSRVPGIRRAYADTPGGVIHYAEVGSGPPLILLHATPGSWSAYRALLPRFGRRFRCIAVDTPGFGQSDPIDGDVSIEGLAGRMVALLDTLHIESTHVFGLHTGNKIAAALAAGWPQRVRRVVLAGQTHSLVVDRTERDAAIQAIVEHYFPDYAQSPDGSHLVRQWTAARAEVESLWWPGRLLNAATVDAPHIEAAEHQVSDYLMGWRAIVPTYRAIFGFDLEQALRRVEAPTLILELLTAHEAHFGHQGVVIQRLMQHAECAVLEGADGSALYDRADDVAAVTVPFLLR